MSITSSDVMMSSIARHFQSRIRSCYVESKCKIHGPTIVVALISISSRVTVNSLFSSRSTLFIIPKLKKNVILFHNETK